MRFTSALGTLSIGFALVGHAALARAEGAEPAPAVAPTPAGFAFGSYGRVRAASDLRGHSGQSTNIVAFGTRYDLGNYAELELRREDHPAELELRVIATLGFQGDFFHYTGRFDDQVGVRNLYAEVGNALLNHVSLWAGSRMVRGDDVYLLNFWPLDNLNLVGGGAAFSTHQVEFRLHGGLTRPSDPFYAQDTPAVPAQGFVPQSVASLDRPRTILAARAAYWPLGNSAPRGFKLIAYAEAHHIADGERQVTQNSGSVEHLPAMSGYVAGLQVGAYWDKPQAFANLFLRCARGLAAYDPLATFGGIEPTPGMGASDCRVAASGNIELGVFAVQLGAYLRQMNDPAGVVANGGKLQEGIVDVRPYFWVGQRAGVALDASYQALRTLAVDESTGRLVGGAVGKLAVIPFYSPYGRGTYTRPQLQLIYAISARNSDAKRLYPELDRRSASNIEHFLAIGAEWWFNSTSY